MDSWFVEFVFLVFFNGQKQYLNEILFGINFFNKETTIKKQGLPILFRVLLVTYDEKVMKNCWRLSFGYWEKEICIQSGGWKS